MLISILRSKAVLSVAFALILIQVNTQVIAQGASDLVPKSSVTEHGWKWSISGNYQTIDSDVADSASVGDDAFGIDLLGSYYFSSQFIGSLGVGFIAFDDDAEFQEQVIVTDLSGSDTETLESNAGAIPVFAEVNYQSRATGAAGLRYRLGAGFSQFVFAERGINNCSDCREENLDIDGGAYVAASVLYDATSNNKFGVSAKRYLSGDLSNGISLWFEFSR